MRVKGHALRSVGRPFLIADCCGDSDLVGIRRNLYDGIGHAVCECGAKSVCLDAHSARQQWHRQHKHEVASRSSSTPRNGTSA